MIELGFHFSQLDAEFPLSIAEGATLGVEYILRSLRRGQTRRVSADRYKPQGMTDAGALASMRQIYRRVVRIAEESDIVTNTEPHGYYATMPEFVAEMLSFCDSPCLRVIMADDELYHRLDLYPNARVLLEAYSDPERRGTGRDEPVAWTTTPANPRVFVTTLRHDASALQQPGESKLFARTVEWCATGKIDTPVPSEPLVRVLAVTSGHSYPPSFY